MRQNGTILHRQTVCRWCGEELEHKATGRARKFCSPRCRVSFNRAMKRYARECIDAALAGRPEPFRNFGYPIEICSYIVNPDGTVTRRERVTERI
jgi:endogenous inhibitor of DNA gyrase (YacG/DUF329 family)